MIEDIHQDSPNNQCPDFLASRAVTVIFFVFIVLKNHDAIARVEP